VVDAWFIANGRDLDISDDRRGTQRWLTDEQELTRVQAALAASQTEAEKAQAEASRERQARLELEQRVRELESKLQR